MLENVKFTDGDKVTPESYWKYAFKHGMPSSSAWYSNVTEAMETYVMGNPAGITIKYAEDDRGKGSPSFVSYRNVNLLNHWNNKVDLVIATGHGKWIASFVTQYKKQTDLGHHDHVHSLGTFNKSGGRQAGNIALVGVT